MKQCDETDRDIGAPEVEPSLIDRQRSQDQVIVGLVQQQTPGQVKPVCIRGWAGNMHGPLTEPAPNPLLEQLHRVLTPEPKSNSGKKANEPSEMSNR